MDYTQLINDFVEGNMDAGHEEQFFLSLASNNELRSELKQQLAIENALMKDSKAIQPSTAVTSMLFARLGFDAPTPQGQAVPKQGFGDKIVNIANRFSQAIITGVATATACVVVFMAISGNDSDSGALATTDTNQPAAELKTYNIVPENSSDIQGIPVVSSESVEHKASTVIDKPIQKVVKDGNYFHIPDIKASSYNEDETSMTIRYEDMEKMEFSNDMIFAHNELDNNIKIQKLDNDINKPQMFDNENITFINTDGPKLGWSWELQGNANLTQFGMDAGSDSPGTLKKLGIAGYYELNDKWSLGMEYRSETFDARYNKQRGIFDAVDEDTRLELNSFSIGGRYKLYDSRVSDIYSQINLGVSNEGILGRLGLGANLAITDDFSLFAGFEYSILGNSYQNTNYDLHKLNFNYGISYNL